MSRWALYVMLGIVCHVGYCMSCWVLYVMLGIVCHARHCMSCWVLYVMLGIVCHVGYCMSCWVLYVMLGIVCHVWYCMSWWAMSQVFDRKRGTLVVGCWICRCALSSMRSSSHRQEAMLRAVNVIFTLGVMLQCSKKRELYSTANWELDSVVSMGNHFDFNSVHDRNSSFVKSIKGIL